MFPGFGVSFNAVVKCYVIICILISNSWNFVRNIFFGLPYCRALFKRLVCSSLISHFNFKGNILYLIVSECITQSNRAYPENTNFETFYLRI